MEADRGVAVERASADTLATKKAAAKPTSAESVAAAHAGLRHADRDKRAAVVAWPKSALRRSHNYYRDVTVRPPTPRRTRCRCGASGWTAVSTSAPVRKSVKARNLAANPSCVDLHRKGPRKPSSSKAPRHRFERRARDSERSSRHTTRSKYRGVHARPQDGPDLRMVPTEGRVRPVREEVQAMTRWTFDLTTRSQIRV